MKPILIAASALLLLATNAHALPYFLQKDLGIDIHNTSIDVSAQYHLNFLDKPRILVDKLSGHITIDGLKHYTGQCAKMAATQ